jgi:hypothetical protein
MKIRKGARGARLADLNILFTRTTKTAREGSGELFAAC